MESEYPLLLSFELESGQNPRPYTDKEKRSRPDHKTAQDFEVVLKYVTDSEKVLMTYQTTRKIANSNYKFYQADRPDGEIDGFPFWTILFSFTISNTVKDLSFSWKGDSNLLKQRGNFIDVYSPDTFWAILQYMDIHTALDVGSDLGNKWDQRFLSLYTLPEKMMILDALYFDSGPKPDTLPQKLAQLLIVDLTKEASKMGMVNPQNRIERALRSEVEASLYTLFYSK